MTEKSGASRSAWTSPEPELVADRTWRIALPMPEGGLPAVNCYVVTGDERTVIIDPGCADDSSVDKLEADLTSFGVTLPGDVLTISTHVHSDHYPGAVLLRRRHGVEVCLGEGERASLAAIAALPTSLAPQVAALRQAGACDLISEVEGAGLNGDFDRAAYEEPDTWLSQSDTIELGGRSLRILATPGHTQGHVVVLDPAAGLLFSGDHLLPHITPSVGFEAVPSQRPLRTFLASLASLLELPDLRMLPAHGPAGMRTHDRVRELLAHHAGRLQACLAKVEAPTTATRVAKALVWTSRSRTFGSLDEVGRVLAVLEAAAHLDVLVDGGELTHKVENGVEWYSLASTSGRS